MRNIFTLFFLTFSLLTTAQSKQTHIPASKSIFGIWRQTGIVNRTNGQIVPVLSGNYKVINADGTFYTFVSWGTRDPEKGTTIGQYGSFEIKSDSTLVEHIIKHVIDSNLSGTTGVLKYKLIDEKTLMMAWKNNNGIWVDEKWTRLPLSR